MSIYVFNKIYNIDQLGLDNKFQIIIRKAIADIRSDQLHIVLNLTLTYRAYSSLLFGN